MNTDLLQHERDSRTTGPAPRRRHGRGRRWIIVALVFTVLATVLGYLGADEVRANTEFDQTHATVDATRQHIATVLADLATVRRQLEVAEGQVGAASTALDQDATRLQEAQQALANARSNVSHQHAMIGDLQACLGGVEQASNALAVGDQDRAIDALDAVSTSCASAVAAGG